jgi:hypothetical protein
LKQKQKHKEVWTVRHEWSTENNGDTYEVIDLIAFNTEQVDKYLHKRYNLEGSQDYSDGEENLVYSYSGIYDELGNEVKHNIEECYEGEYNDQLKEGYYDQTDTVSASLDYTLVTDSQIEELKSKFSYHVVIDLTENQ